MAKLVYGLQQSLDGYVDHLAMGPPGPSAFRHFIEHVRDLTGMVYGRRMYEIMRYWDEDRPDDDAEDRRLRDGVAEQAEVGCIAHVEVGRAQCHTCRG